MLSRCHSLQINKTCIPCTLIFTRPRLGLMNKPVPVFIFLFLKPNGACPPAWWQRHESSACSTPSPQFSSALSRAHSCQTTQNHTPPCLRTSSPLISPGHIPGKMGLAKTKFVTPFYAIKYCAFPRHTGLFLALGSNQRKI